jgi:hypothetical protein
MDLETHPQHIVVCDNRSTDESIDRIHTWGRQRFPDASLRIEAGQNYESSTDRIMNSPRFVLIQNAANLGFSAGNNCGIRYLLQDTKSDFIWLLNNDTTVHPKALGALLALTEKNPQMGVVGSTIVYDNDRNMVQCAGGCRYYPATTIFRWALGGSKTSTVIGLGPEIHLDYVYGASMFIRAEAFRQIGLLNEEYFLYYEEADFCRRAVRSGYQIGWCPESIIYHKAGGTIGTAATGDRLKLAISNYHENLSTLVFTREFFPHLLPFAMAFRFFGKLASILYSGQLFLMKPILYAYHDFFYCNSVKEVSAKNP